MGQGTLPSAVQAAALALWVVEVVEVEVALGQEECHCRLVCRLGPALTRSARLASAVQASPMADVVQAAVQAVEEGKQDAFLVCRAQTTCRRRRMRAMMMRRRRACMSEPARRRRRGGLAWII